MDEVIISRTSDSAFPVRFAADAFGEESNLADILRESAGSDNPRVMIVADANVVNHTDGLGMKIGRYLKSHSLELAAQPVVLGGGERMKCDAGRGAMRLVAMMLEAQIGKNDVVVAMGGGVLLDMAGYAAAQVRGGLNLVRMPTSTAAMVDACFAEYAALNGKSVKDAIRVPSTPAAVVVDVTFAKTNLPKVYSAGFAEAIRIGAVQDGRLVKMIADRIDLVKEGDLRFLEKIVRRSAELRAANGQPQFALWCAARLEAMSNYRLPHGYAIPIAICIDAAYSAEKEYLAETEQATICRTLYDIDALGGLHHSVHIVSNVDALLGGLDGWRLSSGSEAIELPGAVGERIVESTPDRDAYAKVLRDLALAAAIDS